RRHKHVLGRRRQPLPPALRVRCGLPGRDRLLPDPRPVLRRRLQLQFIRKDLPRDRSRRLPRGARLRSALRGTHDCRGAAFVTYLFAGCVSAFASLFAAGGESFSSSSTVSRTSSPTATPPASSALFQVSPKSLRLIFPEA